MTVSNSLNNRQWYQRALKSIPGGVNSPVRAFQAVGGNPPFIRAARGCHLEDEEGKRYIDYIGSWGPMILGHAHPEVVEAIQKAAQDGTSFGAPTRKEVLLAEQICSMVPSVERIRLVSSGTEATMSALRLARAQTGRSLAIKFNGCYHGHGDSFLVQAGSGAATLGLPDSPGVPSQFSSKTLSLPYNRIEEVEKAFSRFPEQIAAVILEPVTGNMGVVVPAREYLESLLRLASKHGALVIFDEVMTGFRLAAGGAQEYFSLSAPLTCLGKIVGGGLPIGAYGGAEEIMDMVAPQGPVYQAGTLSGNPLAVTAGLKTLEILHRDPPYRQLESRTRRLCEGIRKQAQANGIAVQVPHCGSMFTIFFHDRPITDFETARQCNRERFAAFFQGMLKAGIYLAPSQFEACFVSLAHGEQIIDETIEKAGLVFQQLGS